MGLFGKKPTAWERKPGEIAARIEADDVKRIWFNRPFIVQEGAAALMLSRGRLLGRVEAGEYDIDGVLRKFFHGEAPTTLVMIDDGEMPLDINLDYLYSSDQIQLGASLRLTVGLGDPELFYQNVMRERRGYTMSDLASHLHPELTDAVLALTSTTPIDELFNNPSLRSNAEATLQDRIGTNLAAMGFTLTTVNVVSFSSPTYDAHRKRQGDVNMYGRTAELEGERIGVLRRAREIAAENAKHEARSEASVQDVMKQAVHDSGVRDRLNAGELATLEATLAQDMMDFTRRRERESESAELDHTLDADAKRSDHQRAQKKLDFAAFLDERVGRARAESEIADLEREGALKDHELNNRKRNDALDAMAKMKSIKADDLERRASVLNSVDTATKIALGEGNEKALLELDRLEKQERMTPDQLLVLAAENNPQVAVALAEKLKAEGRMNDELMDQLRRQLDTERSMHREHAMQVERILNTALGQMGNVAAVRSEAHGPASPTVITGGRGGHTVTDPSKKDKDKDKDDD